MILCPNCRAPNPDSFQFCGRCGKPLKEQGSEKPPEEEAAIPSWLRDLQNGIEDGPGLAIHPGGSPVEREGLPLAFSPRLFCPLCARYVGAAGHCVFCGWERPAAEAIPLPGVASWETHVAGQPSELFLAADRLLVGTREGTLYVLNLDTKEVCRRHELGDLIRPLSCCAERVFVPIKSGQVVALRANGEEILWRYSIGGQAGGVLATAEALYLGDSQGQVYALRDAGDHAEIIWPPCTAGQYIRAAPSVWGHLLFLVTHHHDGRLVAVDRRGGQVLWERPLRGRGGVPPLVVDALVLAATEGGQVWAFQLPTGDPAWGGRPFDAGVHVSVPLVAAGKQVYMGTWSGEIIALDVATGRRRWPVRVMAGTAVVSGLAWWHGLLFVGSTNGQVRALEADTGRACWCFDLGSEVTAGLLVGEGEVYVAGGDGRVVALPWHLGQWTWAANWCAARRELISSASFYALAGDSARAAAAWAQAGLDEAAAWMWAAQGEDQQAGGAFWEAARKRKASEPATAGWLFFKAAEHLEVAGARDAAAECRHQASRMIPIPYLTVELTNLPDLIAGEPGRLALRVRNEGQAAARDISFELGGALALLVRGTFEEVWGGEQVVLELDDVIPTVVGESELRVTVAYAGTEGKRVWAEASFPVRVGAPPQGTITVEGDGGAVVVRLPEGAPLPAVRVRGDVGMVRYEVVPGWPAAAAAAPTSEDRAVVSGAFEARADVVEKGLLQRILPENLPGLGGHLLEVPTGHLAVAWHSGGQATRLLAGKRYRFGGLGGIPADQVLMFPRKFSFRVQVDDLRCQEGIVVEGYFWVQVRVEDPCRLAPLLAAASCSPLEALRDYTSSQVRPWFEACVRGCFSKELTTLVSSGDFQAKLRSLLEMVLDSCGLVVQGLRHVAVLY